MNTEKEKTKHSAAYLKCKAELQKLKTNLKTLAMVIKSTEGLFVQPNEESGK